MNRITFTAVDLEIRDESMLEIRQGADTLRASHRHVRSVSRREMVVESVSVSDRKALTPPF